MNREQQKAWTKGSWVWEIEVGPYPNFAETRFHATSNVSGKTLGGLTVSWYATAKFK